ncbi:uncharacterized protein LOC128204072 isoform X2 [Mya arenaria]|uniref:uncharacterized protein LOC128204072 isoform X2 n=1 Tax=Mya arenaria TaxID=6604 RepID=UPI0022DFEAB7|nr:uncharacterized protein LOC128204072 isoform X2 [Mya arenaria]
MCCQSKNASCCAITSFVLAVCAYILHMFGFYTVGWATADFPPGATNQLSVAWYFGLWDECYAAGAVFRCRKQGCEPDGYPVWFPYTGWLKATQAFETLGFIAAVAALILIVLYVFVPATSGKRIVFILSMVACFIAAGCILLGIIIYGTKMDYNLSWSFALCCIAGIIFAVAGLLLAIDFCKR